MFEIHIHSTILLLYDNQITMEYRHLILNYRGLHIVSQYMLHQVKYSLHETNGRDLYNPTGLSHKPIIYRLKRGKCYGFRLHNKPCHPSNEVNLKYEIRMF